MDTQLSVPRGVGRSSCRRVAQSMTCLGRHGADTIGSCWRPLARISDTSSSIRTRFAPGLMIALQANQISKRCADVFDHERSETHERNSCAQLSCCSCISWFNLFPTTAVESHGRGRDCGSIHWVRGQWWSPFGRCRAMNKMVHLSTQKHFHKWSTPHSARPRV